MAYNHKLSFKKKCQKRGKKGEGKKRESGLGPGWILGNTGECGKGGGGEKSTERQVSKQRREEGLG